MSRLGLATVVHVPNRGALHGPWTGFLWQFIDDMDNPSVYQAERQITFDLFGRVDDGSEQAEIWFQEFEEETGYRWPILEHHVDRLTDGMLEDIAPDVIILRHDRVFGPSVQPGDPGFEDSRLFFDMGNRQWSHTFYDTMFRLGLVKHNGHIDARAARIEVPGFLESYADDLYYTDVLSDVQVDELVSEWYLSLNRNSPVPNFGVPDYPNR